MITFDDDGVPFNATTTPDDISACFRLLLGRFPSRAEWVGHSARENEPLADVVGTYVNSLEFFNRGLTRPRTFSATAVELQGFVLYVSPDDFAVGKHILTARDYEPHVSRVFRQVLAPGMSVLDIGANIGFYAMLAASIVGPGGRVWAIEPNPNNVKFILASKSKNGFEQLAIIQAAAGSSWESMCLFSDGSNGTVEAISADDPSLIREPVLSLPLSALIGQKHIDVIKIDVEGAEGKVLRDLTEVLRSSRPIIFAEFTPGALPVLSAMSGEELLRFLIDVGYDISVLSETPIDCGRDLNRVMSEFVASGLAHVDLMARPRARR